MLEIERESERGALAATTTTPSRSAIAGCVRVRATARAWLVAVRAVRCFSAEAGVSAGVGEPPVMLSGVGVAVAVLQPAALQQLA